MEELLGIFCVLAIILVVVTFVGHLLWLLMASVARRLGLAAPADNLPGSCPICLARGSLIGNVCQRCRCTLGSPESIARVRDIHAAYRELLRLERSQLLTPSIRMQLEAEFNSDLQALGCPRFSNLASLATPAAPIGGPLPGMRPMGPGDAATTADHVQSLARSAPAAGAEADHVRPIDFEEALEPTVTFEPVATFEAGAPVEASVVSPFAAAAAPAASSDADANVLDAAMVEFSQLPAATNAGQPKTAAAGPVVYPPSPRRTLADLLQAFMEESNIRWVELISGTVIVVCAIGLVISLRATLQDTIPYFPALMFALVTGGIHFAGVYSLRSWNLKSTSRGVLIIASLLVPLNFLAAVVLVSEKEQQRSAFDPIYLSAVAVLLAAFTVMNYFATRALIRRGTITMMLGVLGPSACQLIINRLAPLTDDFISVGLLLAPPVILGLLSLAHPLQITSRRPRFSFPILFELLLRLGLVGFSLAAALLLFVVRSPLREHAISLAAPWASLLAAAIVATGVSLHQRVLARSLRSYQVTGTAIAIFGALLMISFLVLAWPLPAILVTTAILNGLVLLAIASLSRMPILVGPAVFCCGVAAVFAVPQVAGNLPFSTELAATTSGELSTAVVQEILMARTCMTLVSVIALAAVAAGVLQRKRLGEYARHALFGAVALAGVAVTIAVRSGFVAPTSDNWLAGLTFALFAAASIFATRIVRHVALGWTSAALTLLTFCQWMTIPLPSREFLSRYCGLERDFFAWSLCCYSLFAAIVSGGTAWSRRLRRGDFDPSQPFDRLSPANFVIFPWGMMSLLASLPAGIWMLPVREQAFTAHAAAFSILAAAWLVVAVAWLSPVVIQAAQVATSVAVAYICAAICQRTGWWSNDMLWSGQHANWQIATVGLWNVAWATVRAYAHRPTSRAAIRAMFPDRPYSVEFQIFQLLGVVTLLLAMRIALVGYEGELQSGVWPPVNQSWYADLGGVASWLGLMVAIAGLVISYLQVRSPQVLMALVVASAAAPLLATAPLEPDRAVASGLRWAFAAFGVVWSIPVLARTWLPYSIRPSTGIVNAWRSTSLAVAVTTVVGWTTLVFVQVLFGLRPGGPLPGTFFDRIGSTVSYALPLGLLVAVSVAYAIRDRLPSLMAVGSLLLQYFVTLACLLPRVTAGLPIDGEAAGELLIWNSVGLAAFAIVWLAAAKWIQGDYRIASSYYLLAQIIAMTLANALIAIACGIGVLGTPSSRQAIELAFGHWPHHLAIILAVGVLLWSDRRLRRFGTSTEVGSDAIAVPSLGRTRWIVLGAACLTLSIAATLDRYDLARNWWGYHAVEFGWVLVAAGCLVNFIVARMRGVTAPPLAGSMIALTLLCAVSLLATYAADDDPRAPWWGFAAVVSGIVLCAGWTFATRRIRFALATMAFAPMATATLWIHSWIRPIGDRFVEVLHVQAAAICLMGAFWMSVHAGDLWRRRAGLLNGSKIPAIPIVVWLVILPSLPLFLIFVPALAAAREAGGGSSGGPFSELCGLYGLTYIVLLGIYCILAQWERHVAGVMVQLYLWGFLAVAFLVGRMHLDVPRFVATVRAEDFGFARTLLAEILGIAAYSAFAAYVWSRSNAIAYIAHRMQVPDPIARLRHLARWFPFANLAVLIVASVYAVFAVLNLDLRGERIMAAFIPALAAAAAALMAQQGRRRLFQAIALTAAYFAAVLLSWADMTPGSAGLEWLERSVRILIVSVALAVLYGAILARVFSRAGGWSLSCWHAAIGLGVAAAADLLVVLGMEWILFEPGIGTPISTPSLIAVTLVCAAMVVALLVTAGAKRRFPGLGDRARMGCVYAAQVVALLIFAHIFAARPYWFQGRFRQWWPLIIMLLAYGGVGASEILRRLQQPIFAEPLSRSGLFLPLLPAVSIWFIPHRGNDAVLLLFIGILYAMIGLTRKSFWAGAASALAGNAALWVFFHQSESLRFANHPQFWLIPPAVSVLVAGQFHRDRLSPQQLAGIRYGCMMLIYLSSTSEVFFVSAGKSIAAPMILALLSLAGVATGIALRVRAFLYLGSGFVFLSVFSMVWNAYQNIRHVGIWWAFGIALGIGILTLYGMFEMKKEKIRALIERLRQWEQ